MKTKKPDNLEREMSFLRFLLALIFDSGLLALYFAADPKSLAAVDLGFRYLWSLLWAYIK